MNTALPAGTHVLTVGIGKTFATVAAAVNASHDGDVIRVDAGTYTNDFATITHKITIEGMGGMVKMVATIPPPNSKGIFVVDNDVTIKNLSFSGAAISAANGGNGAGIAFANPLDLRVGSPVAVAHANGPDYADYDFTVQEIREYNRRIQGQEFRFTDYVLRGVSSKTLDADDVLPARLRVVPNQAGAHDSLLLRLYDEFEFAEDFLAVVKDTTGLFKVTDDKSGAEVTYSRINDLRESYQAAVLIVAETTPDGKGAPGKVSPDKVEYWDYWRESDIGANKTAKEFIFVEMNSDTGWFQIWRGREFFA